MMIFLLAREDLASFSVRAMKSLAAPAGMSRARAWNLRVFSRSCQVLVVMGAEVVGLVLAGLAVDLAGLVGLVVVVGLVDFFIVWS